MHKILVADDSLTIQKVIKITLANEKFEIIECLSAEELRSQVREVKPDIILLDFNLSEDKTGYELASDVLDIHAESKILMLFGTFDTIDEDMLKQSGVDFKIVKPFDGSKFITLCHAMRDSFGDDEDDSLPDVIKSEETQEEEEEEDWVMDSPSSNFFDDEPEEIDSAKTEKINISTLQASVDDWSMDVPGIIGHDSDHIEFPDVIGKVKSPKVIETLKNEDGIVLPKDEDLEFPDMESKSSPKLIPIDEFIVEEEIPDEIEDSEDDFDLASEIEDEIDESDLWTADEEIDETDKLDKIKDFIPLKENDLPHVESHSLREVKPLTIEEESDSFDDVDFFGDAPSDFPADVMDSKNIEPVKAAAPIFDESKIEELLKEKMTPMIESLVKEYCQANIEKIAWEIIPDLAENLIKRELEKITESILDSE